MSRPPHRTPGEPRPDPDDDPPELLREAMDLWRDDVDRRARLFATERSAAAVRAALARGAAENDWLPAHVARRYVAAAILLLGLGGSGALWLGPHPEQATLLSSGNALRLVEYDRLQDSLDRVAWPLEPVPSPHAGRKGR
ncbi:MAG: hypothetical protein ACC662_05575 [Planctomycetota bacterium]